MNARDAVFAVLVVALVAVIGYNVASLLGFTGTHEHADLAVYLDSDQPYDFSAERYQLAADEVHLEEGQADADGARIHMHAEELTLADFFTSIGWQVSQEAITTDRNETYEADDRTPITVRVDGEPAQAGFDVPLEPGASYVVVYGDRPAGD